MDSPFCGCLKNGNWKCLYLFLIDDSIQIFMIFGCIWVRPFQQCRYRRGLFTFSISRYHDDNYYCCPAIIHHHLATTTARHTVYIWLCHIGISKYTESKQNCLFGWQANVGEFTTSTVIDTGFNCGPWVIWLMPAVLAVTERNSWYDMIKWQSANHKYWVIQ